MNKKAIITGITGQDGSYLAELLLDKGYEVHGIMRRSSVFTTERIEHLMSNDKIYGKKLFIHHGDMTDSSNLTALISKINPKEIYNLAAQSHVKVSFEVPEYTADVDAIGCLRLLDAMYQNCPDSKFYQASTSVGGDTPVLIKQNEEIRLEKIKNLGENDSNKTYYDNLECLTIDDNYNVKFSKVNYVFSHNSNNIYNLRGSNGLDLVITGDHSVIILNENGELIEKVVQDLNKNDLLLSFNESNHCRKNPSFDLKEYRNLSRSNKQIDNIAINSDIMRLLGYYVADGNVSYLEKKQYNINFTFHLKEKYYIEDIKNIIKENFGIDNFYEKESPKEHTRKISFSSKQFCNFLLNNFKTGSHNKIIPSWMFNLSKHDFIEFMRGYIGDSYDNGYELIYTSCNEFLINQLCYISKLNKLDCRISFRYSNGNCVWDLKFSRKHRSTLLGEKWESKGGRPTIDELLPYFIAKRANIKNKNKKSTSKETILKQGIKRKDNNFVFKLAKSDLHIIRIKEIKKIDKNIRVYDLHVPETQRFIGGNYPILLHNSEMFGGRRSEMPKDGYDENNSFHPRSPYGAAKLYAYWITKNYREAYGSFSCNGILFNHESSRRGETFVTKKITRWCGENLSLLRERKFQFVEPLRLGNMDAYRDWGHVKDYVKSQWLILQQDEPDDYVVATGETHTVREFVKKCFDWMEMPLEWSGSGINEVGVYAGNVVVRVDKKYFRPSEVDVLLGNPSKIKKIGWKPEFDFDMIIDDMMKYDCYQPPRIICPHKGIQK